MCHATPTEDVPELVQALLCPAAFPHSVGRIDMIETHISWVVLAGDYAYKVKKPVVLDFLDFGDLEKRRHFCLEELRLNRRWAPRLYLDVVPIVRVRGQPRFGGTGTPVEYAVRMRRFDERLRLDHQLDAGQLGDRDMRELAGVVAGMHALAPVVPAAGRQSNVRKAIALIRENFAPLEGAIGRVALEDLREWTETELERTAALLRERFDHGYVRDCHGDLHLGNLVRLPTGITAFDCIEFNTALRHIDLVCDIAFLMMDLVARGRKDLAWCFLNRYLERTGDYPGIKLLDLYVVYRALVRAKVAAIRAAERHSDAASGGDREEALRYVEVSRRQISRSPPVLVVMSGLSGSGKTFVSGGLMAELPAIRIRADVERKRLFGLAETAGSGSGIGAGMYSPAANQALHAKLNDTARVLLAAGHSVILDAAHLKADERREARRAARDSGYPAVLLCVEAPVEQARARIRGRAAVGSDASEAGFAVLAHQVETAEPPGDTDRDWMLVCDNREAVDVRETAARIAALARAAC